VTVAACPGEIANRSARLARLRELLPPGNTIVGVDLADDKQAAVVTDHDKPLPGQTQICLPQRKAGTLLAERLCAVSVKDRKGRRGAVPSVHSAPRSAARFYGVGSANVAPKISLLPKVDGQSCWGAGAGTEVPVRSDIRQASIAEQSAALRTSFQTPEP
jgi:hypothetical protein